MAKQAKHSELPWKHTGGGLLENKDKEYLLVVVRTKQTPDRWIRNVGDVLHCVNTHAKLVKGCEAAKNALRSYEHGNSDPTLAKEVAGFLEAALAGEDK